MVNVPVWEKVALTLEEYESKRTSLSTFEYLMRYGNAAVTYKDEKLVYDIF